MKETARRVRVRVFASCVSLLARVLRGEVQLDAAVHGVSQEFHRRHPQDRAVRVNDDDGEVAHADTEHPPQLAVHDDAPGVVHELLETERLRVGFRLGQFRVGRDPGRQAVEVGDVRAGDVHRLRLVVGLGVLHGVAPEVEDQLGDPDHHRLVVRFGLQHRHRHLDRIHVEADTAHRRDVEPDLGPLGPGLELRQFAHLPAPPSTSKTGKHECRSLKVAADIHAL